VELTSNTKVYLKDKMHTLLGGLPSNYLKQASAHGCRQTFLETKLKVRADKVLPIHQNYTPFYQLAKRGCQGNIKKACLGLIPGPKHPPKEGLGTSHVPTSV